jgi:metal-sulfur cluster biosynthetic enzyme
VDIYELGLIYAVEIGDDGAVKVEMTLTTPSCPSAQELPEQVEEAVRAVPGVTDVKVEVVCGPALGSDPDERGCSPRPEHVLALMR